MQGLMNAWGQTNSPYDLNQDGTVDVDDLLCMLSKWPDNQSAVDAPPAPDAAINSVVAEPGVTVGEQPNAVALNEPPADTEAPPMTLKGLMAAWGQTNSPYDLNADGVVDVDDLLQWLDNWPDGAGESGPQAAQAPASAKPSLSANTSASMADIGKLADRLIDRLTAAGFDTQPPTNIREVVDRLNLPPRQTSHIFKRLAAMYPQGMGVNVVG
jgi:hypothetical protein